MKSGKSIFSVALGLAFMLAGSPLAWAAEEAAEVAGLANSTTLIVVVIAAAFCVTGGSIVPALGQRTAVKAACEGMARNPGVAGKLMTTMILGLAMMESLAIYSLVVALILLLANPFI